MHRTLTTPRSTRPLLGAPLLAATLLTGSLLAGCGTSEQTELAEVSPGATAAPSPTGPGAQEELPQDLTTTPASLAVQGLLDALSTGEVDQAYDLLAPASQEAVGFAEGFADVFPELQEGFGRYAGTDTPLVVTDVDELGAVTLVSPDGEAVTLPYRSVDGAIRFDTFARAEGAAEFASPERVEAGAQVRVLVPFAEVAVVSLDGDVLPVERSGADGDQVVLTTTLQEAVSASDGVLTAVWVDAQGRIGSDAVVLPVG